MIIIGGMFKGHGAVGFYPFHTGDSSLVSSGVIVCPEGCGSRGLHATYDGAILPLYKLMVKDADEGRVIKAAWPKEFWARWQLGEDRLFHLREELPGVGT